MTAPITHITDSPEQTDGLSRLSMSGERSGSIGTVAGLLRLLRRGRVWVASAAVFGVFAWVFFASSAPFSIPEVGAACGQQPPDMRFFTSAEEVTGFLDGCGSTGRTTYRNMQLADLVYPAVVGLFMASSLALVVGRLTTRRPNLVWLALIPLLGSLFDYVENLFAWVALARYPASAPTDVLLGYASAAKTITSWAAGVLLLGALAILCGQLLWRKVRPSQTEPGETFPVGRRAVSA